MRAPSRPAMVIGIAVASVLAVTGLGLPSAGPARAAVCPPSGGGTIAPADVSTVAGDVVFRGGGWGHGLGMSQYGAQGAALLGCSATDILTRYYAGSTVTSAPMPDKIRLRLLDDGDRVDVEAATGPLTWVLPGCETDPASCPPVQPQGARWSLRLDDVTRTTYQLWDRATSPEALVWAGGPATTVTTPLRVRQAGSVARLTTWSGGARYLDRWVRFDETVFTREGTTLDAVHEIGPSVEGAAMDKYLWGIAEVPSSFPPAALQAQAIAARTYAAKRAGRILMPTPADQNWTGWAKESEGPGGVHGLAWKAAVDATSGQVVTSQGSGALVDAFYSSSMGGHTEDGRYVWGTDAPFLRAVDDSAWDAASSNPPERRSWAVGVTWETLAEKLGFTSISTVSVPRRGSADRARGVRVTGLRAGVLTTSYVEGWDVREALGLLSPGFAISMRRTGGPAAQPLAGDWDGDGRDEPGWFAGGQVALRMTSPAGTWVKRFRYGQAGDVAVVGDWDRDGRDDLGVFRAGTWLLRAGLTAGPPTRTVTFGVAGDTPVVGSWTGRRLGLGVVRGRQWLLRRTLTAGPAQLTFRYGRPGDTPVVGSWQGGARSGIGVERDGRWLLRNRPSGGRATISIRYGGEGDRAVTGDWDGDGRGTPGVARGATFLLRGTVAPKPPRSSMRTVRFRG